MDEGVELQMASIGVAIAQHSTYIVNHEHKIASQTHDS